MSEKLKKHPYKRKLKFTLGGKIYVLVTIGVGLAAINTGNNLLFLVLSVMLSLIIASGILSEIFIGKIEIKRTLQSRATAEKIFPVELSLTNKKNLFPSLGVELRDHINDKPFKRTCFFLRVSTKEMRGISYRCEVPKRGYAEFNGVTISTRFPFGLFEKSRYIKMPEKILIWPKASENSRFSFPVLQGRGGENHHDKGHGDEFFQMRNYQAGDDRRKINWKATARLEKMIICENHKEQEGIVHLNIDPFEKGLDEASFEKKISDCVAALNYYNSMKVGVVLRINRGASVECMGHERPVELLDSLALIPPFERLNKKAASGENKRIAS